jgi:2-polyprenyl-6-methoxyphenol hydroxylase-like FAD-dependent oxidoreductase
MEIFRTVGVEQIVRGASEQQFVQDGAIMAVETLTGRELAYFIANLNEGVRDVSPTERVFISQSLLEPLLKARAEELGAELRFGTDMVSFERDAHGVSVVLRHRDSGNTDIVRVQYLIAADGAHSSVRQQLGIGMRGHGVFSNSVTIYFRADVAPLLRGRNLSVIYVNNPTLRGFIRVEKPFDRGFLAINALGDPARPVTDVATGLTYERAIDLVRTALGVDDIPISIENVMPWKAAADVADRFREGRVFLAGDSAHVMPPNGGFGGNTGVQDAHNLAWKLAHVVRGVAGDALLDTYETERKPVAEFTTEQAYSRYVTRTAPYLGTDGMQPVADDLTIELGYGYRSSAVCVNGIAPLHVHPREARARPGTRAPHVWIDRDGERLSTLDLFGTRFVLIAAADAGAWCTHAQHAADSLGLEVDLYRIGDEVFTDSAGAVASAYDLEKGDAVLIRPDGFVGWRSPRDASGGSARRDEMVAAFSALTGRR